MYILISVSLYLPMEDEAFHFYFDQLFIKLKMSYLFAKPFSKICELGVTSMETPLKWRMSYF